MDSLHKGTVNQKVFPCRHAKKAVSEYDNLTGSAILQEINGDRKLCGFDWQSSTQVHYYVLLLLVWGDTTRPKMDSTMNRLISENTKFRQAYPFFIAICFMVMYYPITKFRSTSKIFKLKVGAVASPSDLVQAHDEKFQNSMECPNFGQSWPFLIGFHFIVRHIPRLNFRLKSETIWAVTSSLVCVPSLSWSFSKLHGMCKNWPIMTNCFMVLCIIPTKFRSISEILRY